jgi:hypothetical protein
LNLPPTVGYGENIYGGSDIFGVPPDPEIAARSALTSWGSRVRILFS